MPDHRSYRIEFDVPCLVRGRVGRRGKVEYGFTKVRVAHDVPVIEYPDIVIAYTAELPRKADGYNQLYFNGGRFYDGTYVFDGDASKNGWPESVWQAKTPLYKQLWDKVGQEMAIRNIGTDDGPNISTFTKAFLYDNDDAWGLLSADAHSMKPVDGTEDDIRRGVAAATSVLDDLVITRREVHVRIGQPCFVVSVSGDKARVRFGDTGVHARLREAPFSNSLLYPRDHRQGWWAREFYCFPIERREQMMEFLAAANLKTVGRVPQGRRTDWAQHDETMDGLELDRAARVFLYEVGMLFGDRASAENRLFLTDGAFFAAFYDLKDFLERKHDPELTSEELERKIVRLIEECDRTDHRMLAGGAKTFIERALASFGERDIDFAVTVTSPGLLPRQG